MIKQVEIFSKSMDVTGLIITKIDGTAKGGALIAIAKKYDLPIHFVGMGEKKEDLLIDSLVERVKKDKIKEVILATSATVEGQTTAYYIQDSLKNLNIKITKLAQGLPVGGEIESLDDGTLNSAFKNRTTI